MREPSENTWKRPRRTRRRDARTKKRIVRLLVEEIIATSVPEPSPQVELIMHWKGGKHTRLVVSRNRTGQHR